MLEAQDILGGKLSGNFQLDAQYYQKDTLIGAGDVSEKMLSNGFLNINYTAGNFSAGLRYEEYLNPLLGIDTRYRGTGIGYRFASFNSEIIEVTVGNFYEQFGSGMIFRAYEDRALGFDNSVDGLRFKLHPIKGVDITGLIGNQRNFWDKGKGIVRGGSMTLNLNSLIEDFFPNDYQFLLEGSIMSRYQADNQSTFYFPENVFAESARLNISGSEFSFETEYAEKNNDPSAPNKYNFNKGRGLLANLSYFPEGLGITLNFHTIDNMDFRSDRDAVGNILNLNFIPPLTKQHIFRLATLYPYATHLVGEIGIQAEVIYTMPKEWFGDKYGANISANFSQVNSINKTTKEKDPVSGQIYTYNSEMFNFGDVLYFRDMNVEFTKKWSPEFKSILSYINLTYNKDVLENEGSGKYGMVKASIVAGEFTYQINRKNAIRAELQHIWSKQDSVLHVPNTSNGNWAFFLLEYTIAPNWFISAFDEYNYGNEYDDYKIHYLSASATYIHGTTRIAFGYGRQRGGILCVGGVCRPVPASNGFLLTISSSF